MQPVMSEGAWKWVLDHWEGVVATIALLQVWAYWSWKWLFRKPDLQVYPSGSVEIGYSEFGPTIGLFGTLKPQNGDVFVKRMRLRVQRVRTKEEHIFTWIAFRSPVMTFGQAGTPPPELPSGFIVSQSQPHRYNVVFNDPEIQADLRIALQPLKPLTLEQADSLRFAKGSIGWKELYDKYRTDYYRMREYTDAFDRLNRRCYWEADQFEIEILIDTDKGDAQYKKSLTIQLSDEQVKQLRLNATVMLENSFRMMAEESSWNYHFAYAEFDEHKQA